MKNLILATLIVFAIFGVIAGIVWLATSGPVGALAVIIGFCLITFIVLVLGLKSFLDMG